MIHKNKKTNNKSKHFRGNAFKGFPKASTTQNDRLTNPAIQAATNDKETGNILIVDYSSVIKVQDIDEFIARIKPGTDVTLMNGITPVSKTSTGVNCKVEIGLFSQQPDEALSWAFKLEKQELRNERLVEFPPLESAVNLVLQRIHEKSNCNVDLGQFYDLGVELSYGTANFMLYDPVHNEYVLADECAPWGTNGAANTQPHTAITRFEELDELLDTHTRGNPVYHCCRLVPCPTGQTDMYCVEIIIADVENGVSRYWAMTLDSHASKSSMMENEMSGKLNPKIISGILTVGEFLSKRGITPLNSNIFAPHEHSVRSAVDSRMDFDELSGNYFFKSKSEKGGQSY